MSTSKKKKIYVRRELYHHPEWSYGTGAEWAKRRAPKAYAHFKIKNIRTTRFYQPLQIKKGKKVRYVTPFTQPKGSMAQFTDLPPEMLAKIGSYLPRAPNAAFRATSAHVAASVPKQHGSLTLWLHKKLCSGNSRPVNTAFSMPNHLVITSDGINWKFVLDDVTYKHFTGSLYDATRMPCKSTGRRPLKGEHKFVY